MRDDSASLYCAIGITLPLAFLALVARLYARRITKAGFWYDDTLAILGFVCGSSFSKPKQSANANISWAQLPIPLWL